MQIRIDAHRLVTAYGAGLGYLRCRSGLRRGLDLLPGCSQPGRIQRRGQHGCLLGGAGECLAAAWLLSNETDSCVDKSRPGAAAMPLMATCSANLPAPTTQWLLAICSSEPGFS